MKSAAQKSAIEAAAISKMEISDKEKAILIMGVMLANYESTPPPFQSGTINIKP